MKRWTLPILVFSTVAAAGLALGALYVAIGTGIGENSCDTDGGGFWCDDLTADVAVAAFLIFLVVFVALAAVAGWEFGRRVWAWWRGDDLR